jgi:hypothetical protein
MGAHGTESGTFWEGTDGLANSGSGGGGGLYNHDSKAGGSGVCVIKYWTAA